jgi:hypothetical protein
MSPQTKDRAMEKISDARDTYFRLILSEVAKGKMDVVEAMDRIDQFEIETEFQEPAEVFDR